MDEQEQLHAILQQMAMGFGRGRGGGGMGRGALRSDMQMLHDAISNIGDDGAQAAGLTELCNALNMATEDTLMALRPDYFVGPILACMRKDYNPELVLLATRALTYMIDSIPVTSQVLVSKNGIDVVCDKLRNIIDIEVAEQALTALDKLAKEAPAAVLSSGGVGAMLSFIDFFSISVQRRAVATVANVCKKLRSSAFHQVRDSLPQLHALMQHDDPKIQEAAFLALNRIVRGTMDNAEYVLAAFGDAAPAIIETLERRQCDATFNAALQLISAAVSSSSGVSEMLVELGIVSTLLGVLNHNAPRPEDSDASFQLPPPTMGGAPSPLRNTPPVQQDAGVSPHSPKLLSSPLLQPASTTTPPSTAARTPGGGGGAAAAARKVMSAEDMKEAAAALVHLLPRAREGYMAFFAGKDGGADAMLASMRPDGDALMSASPSRIGLDEHDDDGGDDGSRSRSRGHREGSGGAEEDGEEDEDDEWEDDDDEEDDEEEDEEGDGDDEPHIEGEERASEERDGTDDDDDDGASTPHGQRAAAMGNRQSSVASAVGLMSREGSVAAVTATTNAIDGAAAAQPPAAAAHRHPSSHHHVCSRTRMLQQSPYLLERIAEALPTLIRLRLEAEHPRLRAYALEFVVRCVQVGEPETLRAGLADAPLCDFLRGALTEDLASQARALHICRVVIEKLGSIYLPIFLREGVSSALAGIKNKATDLPKRPLDLNIACKTPQGWVQVLAATARDLLQVFVGEGEGAVCAELERVVSQLQRPDGDWNAAIDQLLAVMAGEAGVSTFELVNTGVVAALVSALQRHRDPVDAVVQLVSRFAQSTPLGAPLGIGGQSPGLGDSSPLNSTGGFGQPTSQLVRLVRHLQSMIIQGEAFAAPESPPLGTINAQIRLQLIPHGTPERDGPAASGGPAGGRGGRGGSAAPSASGPNRGRGGRGGAPAGGGGAEAPVGKEASVSIEPLANIGAVAGFIAQRLLPPGIEGVTPPPGSNGAGGGSGGGGRDEHEEDAEDVLPELDKDDSHSKRPRREHPALSAQQPLGANVHIRLGKFELPHSMPMTQVLQRCASKDKKKKAGEEEGGPAGALARRGLPPQLMALFQGLAAEETITLHYSHKPFPPGTVQPPDERTSDILTSPSDPVKLAPVPFQTSGAVAVVEALHGRFLTQHLPTMIHAPLRLIRVVHAACQNWWSLLEWFRIRALDTSRLCPDPGVNPAEFVSAKLSSKLIRHAANPLLAGQLADTWCATATLDVPFLFTSQARKFIFDVVYLGTARSLQRIQEHKLESGEQQSNQLRVHRVHRFKLRVWRKHAIECIAKVMELHGNSRDMFEFEYYGEEGSGLGPTLEFYTLCGEGFRDRALNLWRTGDDDASPTQLIGGTNGLFPRPNATSDLFAVFGKFLARALLDKRIPNLRLSRPLLKALRGDVLCIDDVASLSAGVYDTLSTILVAHHKHTSIIPFAKPCDIHDLCLAFTLPGITEEIELTEGGRDLGVDETNMDRYVELAVARSLRDTVQGPIAAMRKAFHEVLPLHGLRVLSVDELSALFGGHDQPLTLAELEANTVCDHGFTNSSPAVRFLFEVLVEMPVEDQRCFFQFLTGSPMLPVGGLKFLRPRFTVVRKTCSEGAKFEKDQLPSAMTCQNFLKLPAYDTKEQTRAKLYTAMKEGAGVFNFT